MRRRDFMKSACVTAAGLAINPQLKAFDHMPNTPTTSTGGLPRRTYKNGIEISVIGFGGILVMHETPDTAGKRVQFAIEKGVNYFDVAPQYGDAEIKLGPALQPFRKNCFLACKTEHRDAEGAKADLQRSLERLRTDHFDLYQLHHLTHVKDDVDTVFARGGAMEVIEEARKDGRIRHVGFSAHSVEAAFAAMDRYPFDSILFPVNFATYYTGNFGPQVIEQAKKKGLAVLALKSMARQKWKPDHPLRKQYGKCWYEPVIDHAQAELAVRFTLSRPVTAALPPGEMSLFEMAVKFARNPAPISEQEERGLATMALDLDPIFRFREG